MCGKQRGAAFQNCRRPDWTQCCMLVLSETTKLWLCQYDWLFVAALIELRGYRCVKTSNKITSLFYQRGVLFPYQFFCTYYCFLLLFFKLIRILFEFFVMLINKCLNVVLSPHLVLQHAESTLYKTGAVLKRTDSEVQALFNCVTDCILRRGN